MKKILILVLESLLLVSFMLTSCNFAFLPNENNGETGAPDMDETTTAGAETQKKPETTTTTTTEEAGNTPAPNGVPETLKILAIGNSFSTDAMQYLYQIAKDAGVKTVILGNLYYGGCSLQQHLTYAQKNSPSYTYYKNTAGSWVSQANYRLGDAVLDEDWDYITMQQTSKTCGLRSSYGETLTKLVDHVRLLKPDATLVWHMTWAYQQDSTHSSFPNYSNSQQKMYEMIIDCVKNCILPEERFELLIPNMTSIQNARTSFLGDTLTRDGYHLDKNIGRYIAGLTYFSAITGVSIENIQYNPAVGAITPDMMAVAKESVMNALAKPYEITPSKITVGEGSGTVVEKPPVIDPSEILNPADFIEADTAVARANGVDLSGYTLLEWDYLTNSYWNCTGKATVTVPSSGTSTYNQNVCSDRKYSISELPVGTVFICDAGWQYRLEIYKQENEKYTGTRPGISRAQFFELNETFLNGCNYVAWNISSNPKSDISLIFQQASCHLRIYVPNQG